MKDGYYLSAYLNPAGLTRVVNVRHRHDHNLALWRRTGSRLELVAHWELERLTGQKMHRTPFLDLADETEFINSLLVDHGLDVTDLVEIWGTPDLATEDLRPLADSWPELAFHSVAHLYSAILMDSEVFYGGTIVGMAVDRGPDRLIDRSVKDRWFVGGVVVRGAVELFPIESPGPLYCEARDRFRMREGSLMALATATRAEGSCDRDELLAQYRFDGPDAVAQSQQLFDRVYRQVQQKLTHDPDFSAEDNLTSAVMKEVQALSVAVMERNLDSILDRYGIDPRTAHLAVAGGYALNCPTNTHLMDAYGFRGFLAPPCVGDSGQAMGIGLAAFHHKSPEPVSFQYPGPYLGRSDGGLSALNEVEDFVARVDDFDLETAVNDLLGGTIAWLNGRSEVGPRALGNRSLLGDPTSLAAKDALNVIKRRQWWRPVAPIVLAERLDEWFVDADPSPYMLRTFPIRPELCHRVPAIAHLDQSARVQSVTRAQNQPLYDLVAAFGSRTGVPMLCNTSLNDQGEPIIDTVAETINFCLRRRVQVAYFNGKRVEFTGFDRYRPDSPQPRQQLPFSAVSVERATAIRSDGNPHGLDDVELFLYLSDLELFDRFDIRRSSDAQQVRALLRARLNAHPELREEAERSMHRNAVHFAAFGSHPLVPHRPDEAVVTG